MDEYPNHNRHHHRNRDDEEENYPPPQPPNYQQDFNPVQAHHHYMPPIPNYNDNYGGDIGPGYQGGPPPSSNYTYGDPPRFESGYPAPPPPAVHHVSHEINNEPPPRQQQHGHHHIPSFIHHHTHEPELLPDNNNSNKPSVRVYTKAEDSYSLTIRDGQVVLAPSDPRDDFQHWIKDERHGIRVKDAEGFPSFALVNKATGQAIKHSFGATQPVQLIPYNPNVFDESILWTESKDLGDTFRCIRMVNNIRLNMDAFNGDKNHGGVRDGTIVVLWEWKKGDNQRWKIAPYCKFCYLELRVQIRLSTDFFSVENMCLSNEKQGCFCFFFPFLKKKERERKCLMCFFCCIGLNAGCIWEFALFNIGVRKN